MISRQASCVGSSIPQTEEYHHGTRDLRAKRQYVHTHIAELDKCANDFSTEEKLGDVGDQIDVKLAILKPL